MANGKVLGQNHITQHFENAIKKEKISHAYIINGEAESGKMELALQFAKALQCEDNNTVGKTPTGVACGKCKSCHQTDTGNQPDIRIVTYEKSGIGVDEIREQINNDIVIKPYSSKHKIYIVPDCEKMTEAAQNALLKTIEEPPEYGIIILLTTNADKFLQTILSRCVVLNIRSVKESTIKNYLMSEFGIGSYDASVAAAFAEGNPGKAVKLATSEEFKELKNSLVQTLIAMEHGGINVITQAVKTAGELKKNIDEFFDLMYVWYRDMLVYKACKDSEKLIFQDDYMAIVNQSEKLSFRDINIILEEIDNAEKRIGSNVNFDATLEVLFLIIRERIQK